MNFELSWNSHSSPIGMGWTNPDGRELFRGSISFEFDKVKHSLTFFYKNGNPDRPLIVGFPGYLADASGSGVFFDFVDFRFSDCTVLGKTTAK